MAQPHIIALWSAPRSLSTSFAKSFSQRDDAVVLHEPFSDCYYFSALRKSAQFGDHAPAHDENGATVEARISASCIASSISQPAWSVASLSPSTCASPSAPACTHGVKPLIFFKELAYQAEPYVTEAFLKKVRHTFLIRHPFRIAHSLKARNHAFNDDDLGVEPLQRLFDRVRKLQDAPPVVVDADQLGTASERTLTRYCDALQLHFDPRMLQWRQGQIRAWHPHEQASQSVWHDTTAASTCFAPAPPLPSLAQLDLSAAQWQCVSKAEEIYQSLSQWIPK